MHSPKRHYSTFGPIDHCIDGHEGIRIAVGSEALHDTFVWVVQSEAVRTSNFRLPCQSSIGSKPLIPPERPRDDWNICMLPRRYGATRNCFREMSHDLSLNTGEQLGLKHKNGHSRQWVVRPGIPSRPVCCLGEHSRLRSRDRHSI